MIARTDEAPLHVSKTRRKLPRIGFAGIPVDTNLIETIVQKELAEIVGIANAPKAGVRTLRDLAPHTKSLNDVNDLLEMKLDGVLAGGPQPLQPEEIFVFLKQGTSVFCTQFPAATSEQTQRLVKAARTCNRLLAADFSYRTLTGVERIRSLLRNGELGHLFGAEFVFHTVKQVSADGEPATGGCLLRLGAPLLDLLLWCLDFPGVKEVTSRLCEGEKRLSLPSRQREDFAAARLILETGMPVQISCSCKLPAGCDAIITGAFHGTKGTVGFQNLNGSLRHFTTTPWRGSREKFTPATASPQGEAPALQWVRQLSQKPCYAPEIENLIPLASTLDRIYGR